MSQTGGPQSSEFCCSFGLEDELYKINTFYCVFLLSYYHWVFLKVKGSTFYLENMNLYLFILILWLRCWRRDCRRKAVRVLQHHCEANFHLFDVIWRGLIWTPEMCCKPLIKASFDFAFPGGHSRVLCSICCHWVTPVLSTESIRFQPCLILGSSVEKTLHIKFTSQVYSPERSSNRLHPWQMHAR